MRTRKIPNQNKVAIITDTHCGVRGDSKAFLDLQESFYNKVFFPYLDAHPEIKTILHGGDMFDRRNNIGFIALSRFRNHFLDPLKERGIDLYVIVGNHDSTYRNTNDVNSPALLLREYPNIHIVEQTPLKLSFDSLELDMVPWFHNHSANDVLGWIDENHGDVMLGHLELAGFNMYKGIPSKHGMNADLLKKYDMVLSGHFHTKSSGKNVEYLGAPFEYTWADADDPRGFHILNLETRELEFIENPIRMFYNIYWNEDQHDTLMGEDLSHLESSMVRIFNHVSSEQGLFDKFLERVRRCGPNSVDVIERGSLILGADEEDDFGKINMAVSEMDTLKTIKGYVDQIDDLDQDSRTDLSELMVTLYTEATTENE